MSKIVVIESFRHLTRQQIEHFVQNGDKVVVVEQYAGLHKRLGPIPGFPFAHPDYIEELYQSGQVTLLPVEQLDEKTFYCYAADKSVEAVEKVYTQYEKERAHFIRHVCTTLKDENARDAFKKALCRELASFYSANILFSRLDRHFGGQPLLVYPESNIENYLLLKSLIERSGQEIFPHPHIEFPRALLQRDQWDSAQSSLFVFFRLFAQTVACCLLGFWKKTPGPQRQFVYGMSLMSPRQLRGNQRGPDFIADEKTIQRKDIVCFPLMKSTPELFSRLKELKMAVQSIPEKGRFFSNGGAWLKLLWLSILTNPLKCSRAMNVASITLFQYFRWLAVLEEVSIKHFITHVDFDIGHIGRNMALKQRGVQTWYFTDSMNLGNVYWGRKDGCQMRHPLWTYLNYDHFVTWTPAIAQYYLSHPTKIKKAHVVGCLWSQQVYSAEDRGGEIAELKRLKAAGKFILVAFDTTYSLKGYATYEEGMVFTKHLLKLLEMYPDVHLVLKEKKGRDIHASVHPLYAPILIAQYREMEKHPRITMFSNQADSASLIAGADMVISFPFTSSTFEALSCRKKAIWHDPMDFYRETVYGQMSGMMTHGFEDLVRAFEEFRSHRQDEFFLDVRSPALEPFTDGKAIDRFRALLTGKAVKTESLEYSQVKAINS